MTTNYDPHIRGVPGPVCADPTTMLILGGACVALVEVTELIVWSNDRRRVRTHLHPNVGLADNELSPLEFDGRGKD